MTTSDAILGVVIHEIIYIDIFLLDDLRASCNNLNHTYPTSTGSSTSAPKSIKSFALTEPMTLPVGRDKIIWTGKT